MDRIDRLTTNGIFTAIAWRRDSYKLVGELILQLQSRSSPWEINPVGCDSVRCRYGEISLCDGELSYKLANEQVRRVHLPWWQQRRLRNAARSFAALRVRKLFNGDAPWPPT